MQFRDGLLIALLSVFALRRRTVTALKSGVQLLRRGNLWTLEISPEDVKGKRALDFTLSLRLSERVDLYLQKFWPLLPGASRHDGLWPSNKGGPMSANVIYDKVCKRTETAFGFRVNPHRFRHAAGTLWSIADPENVRGVKDLLGHASFDKTTEAHYIHNQSVADRWPGIGKGDRNRDCLATGGQIALHGSPKFLTRISCASWAQKQTRPNGLETKKCSVPET